MRITPTLTDESVGEELGSRLAQLRLDRNVTQAALAATAGVGVATLQRLEAGSPVSLTTFLRVLRALGLLDGLEQAVPEPLPNPLREVELRGRRRARARQPQADQADRRPWRWGDEPA